MRLTGGVWTASDFAVVPSPLVSLESQRGASEEDPSLFRPRQALCLLMRKGDSSSVEKGIYTYNVSRGRRGNGIGTAFQITTENIVVICQPNRHRPTIAALASVHAPTVKT
ncbi:hypothetical protein VTJ04DRAFT_8417 [Mycothermus thermophilus]|uniref:uncharacterized protein n=1 Tax=Humicola insolens TaxID=85995 RepID=UPI0037438EAA